MNKTASECIREIAGYVDVIFNRPDYASMRSRAGLLRLMIGLTDIYYQIDTLNNYILIDPNTWSGDLGDALVELNGKLDDKFFYLSKIRDRGFEDYYAGSGGGRALTHEYPIYDNFPDISQNPEIHKINEVVSSINMVDCCEHIYILLEKIRDYLHDIRRRDIDKAFLGTAYSLTDEEKSKLTATLGRIKKRCFLDCGHDYSERYAENLLSEEQKSQLQILKEMQNEAIEKIKEDEHFKSIFLANLDKDSRDIDIFSIFCRLYMTSDWKPFLEACIKFRWCDERIAEQSKEDDELIKKAQEIAPRFIDGGMEKALAFFKDVEGKSNDYITSLIREKMANREISDAHGVISDLYKALNGLGLYKAGSENFRQQINNKK